MQYLRCNNFTCFCPFENFIPQWKETSTHVRCGYGGRCKGYHGWRKRLMKVYIWRFEEDKMLQQTAIRRKLGFFGHVIQSDGLEKGMLLAGRKGRRRRGRPKRRWMDEIH